ncbi:hypothetical protein RCL1_004733 [Eukaryota sp. TZLM3-RCL]
MNTNYNFSESLCHYAFDCLLNHLVPSKKVNTPDFPDTEYPLFVTLFKNNNLRGCIGTFKKLPLHTGIKEFVINASQNDTRFKPVTLNELPHLELSVSLLDKFEEADSPMDFEIGIHGVIITFINNNIKYVSTFLPEVAVEQNWDKETTLRHLVSKSGFSGSFEDVKPNISLVRYISRKWKVSYNVWNSIRSN